MTGDVRLRRVRPEEKTRLYNLFQKFLYEMTNFYDDEPDEQGNLHYGHFESYFDGSDPEREAYFILEDQTVVGFAMLNRYSHLGTEIDKAIAEFTVFPMYRRRHVARRAAEQLLRLRPGKWEVKFNEKNAPAKALWTGLTSERNPRFTHLNSVETVISFSADDAR